MASKESGIPQRAPGELASAAATVNARKAVKAKHIVTVNKPREQIFSAARRWVGNLPDVEIVNEKPGDVIAWKTASGAEVAHAGSVNLHDSDSTAAAGTTEVRIEIDYEPVGIAFGALFDELTSELVSNA